MNRKAVLSLLALFIFLGSMASSAAAAEVPKTWISPENPQSGDDITIYYSDPNATLVFITVYSADGSTAYIRSGYGHEGDTWWIKVSNMPGGDYYYKIDASGPDRYGNHTEVPFHVEGSAHPVDVDSADLISTVISIGAIFLVVVGIILVLDRTRK